MESTSEVVQLKEQASSTLSSTVTKKCVQGVSATSIKEISSLLQAKEGSGIIIEDPKKFVGNRISNNVIKLMYPDDANTVNTASLQNEFVAMAIKDEHGNDSGQLTQQNQEEQSVKSSTSVSTLDGGNTITSLTQLSSASSSSLAKQIATTSVVVEAQETSISSSSSKIATDKNGHVNDHSELNNESVEVEETVTIKKRVEKVSEDVKEDQTSDEDAKSAEQVVTVTSFIEKEQSESSSADKEEEIVEDSIDENQKSVSKSVIEKVTEDTIDFPNGKETKTIKETTVTQETPNGTKTVVTTTTITKEPSTTTIITTPPTPNTEETSVEENKEVENEKSSKVEEKIVEEAEDDEYESEQEEEEEVKEENKPNEDNEADRTVVEEKETPKKEQVQPPEPPQQFNVKEETIVDAPSSLTDTNQLNINNKQDNINNTLKDIISSIDSNIIAEENIAALKEREIELIKKQQELAKEIQQQQIIAQKLAKDNQFKQKEMNNKFNSENNESFVTQKAYQPINNVSKYSTYEEKQDENMYTRKSETFETRESTNVSKKIDLHKIFTPATDSEEILPKNRKLYASSAFYSPTLHPTVEDQVELARRISHSLSDISNHQSRGQSMYVNRKKRSVKWVHEGCGQEEPNETTLEILSLDENKEEGNENNICHLEKVPLRFLMNPYGQMRDINSLRESLNTETGLLSPDVSVEVVTALQTHKGKGAELFAKRRKVSEKWVVDENNVGAQSPSGLPDYHQYQTQPKPTTSSILPAYTDAAKHRVQLNLHQEQLMEKYAKPGLKVVQTPWEAALNSGSASTAFVEENNLSPYPTSILTPSPTPQIYDTNRGGVYQQSPTPVADIYNKPSAKDDYNVHQTTTKSYDPHPQVQSGRQQYSCNNSQRELAYKPSIPQGWKAPGMSLPKVQFESQIKNETELKTNDIRLAANEAARFCEEFNTKDEKEIINLIGDVKESSTASQHNLLSIGVHQFVNHLVKSPELKVSPIPIATQLIIDNAIQELTKKQQRPKENCEINRTFDDSYDKNCDIIVEESESKVNVRKQLQQYEDLHKQFAKQMQQEQLLLKKHESAKLKALINYNKKSNNDKSILSIQGSSEQSAQENKEYVQIPIKELIINFEQQCRQEKSNDASLLQTLNNNNTYCSDSDTTKERNAGSGLHNEDLYMPKDIPIQSYAPPPAMAIPPSVSPFSSNADYEIKYGNKSTNASFPAPYLLPESLAESKKSFGGSNTFPMNKPYQQGFSSSFGHTQPPKQQYLPPQSYQTESQNSNQNVPQVNFNPSPLPYDKLAKFENPPTDNSRHAISPNRNYHLNVRGIKLRNTSPAPFAGSRQSPYTPPSESYSYGGTPTSSPRPNTLFGPHTPNSYTNVSNSQILNAPTYNSLARGWGCSDFGSNNSTGYQAARNNISTPIKYPGIVNASSIPYTDF